MRARYTTTGLLPSFSVVEQDKRCRMRNSQVSGVHTLTGVSGHTAANEPDQTRFGTLRQTQQLGVSWQFPVVFTQELFDTDNLTLLNTVIQKEPDKRHRLLFFVDGGVMAADPELVVRIRRYCEHYATHLCLVAEPVSMLAGEAIKQEWRHVEKMLSDIHQYSIDRHSYVVGIGGGALLDSVGLAAAISHRGIRHIRIPTTVLSQNDSGVGVKNGVNLFGQKNYAGTFAPPFAVLNDYRFIDTLPDREKIAGMAEAVKVGLIRDREFFYWLEQSAPLLTDYEPIAMRHMIQRCAELHMHQICHGGDPFETGSARPLDFGHWAAHKLEILTDHSLRHGEAVAIGIAIDSRYSVLSNLLSPGDEERVCSLLEQLGFTLWHPALLEKNVSDEIALLSGLQDFREHLGGELTITLLSELGTGVEVNEMDEALVVQSVEWLRDRHSEATSE